MASSPQTIYGDEAGFSGNNLFHDSQPYFVYCTLAITHDRAEELVLQAKRNFRLTNPELKGQRLLRHPRGQQAMAWLVEQCASAAKLSVYEKRYTLAGKFFEYIFEPVIASRSSFFYEIGFHRFIANLLYLEVFVSNPHAERTLSDFQALMKSRDATQLPALFGAAGRDSSISQSLHQILTFAIIHQDKIAAEITSLSGMDAVGKWVLDVTTDALFNQLCEWGEQFESLEVYYDPSKPVYAVKDVLFDRMVGLTEKAYMGDRPLTFNLAQPIIPGDSKTTPGIQLADVVASAAAYSLKSPHESVSKTWRERLSDSFGERLVLPFVQIIDFRNPETYANAAVLWLLVERSLRGEDLFENLPQFVRGCLLQHQRDSRLHRFIQGKYNPGEDGPSD